jgi:hypothetical protein
MIKLFFLFGLPFYKVNISSLIKKEKKKLINIITKNYNKNPIRNKWNEPGITKSTLHHSYGDENNKDFKQVDFQFLIPHYKKIIDSFCKDSNITDNYKYTFQIVNYTASKKETFMKPHLHHSCNFSMIHYLNFNSKKHVSTVFHNPYYFNDLLPFSGSFKLFSNKDIRNLWHEAEVILNTIEDDVVIFPSVLKHSVIQPETNELRIVVASNIVLQKDI